MAYRERRSAYEAIPGESAARARKNSRVNMGDEIRGEE
jgi:hypothetical protein